ncbi:MAG: HAD family hydrolase [Gemmatimonadota bacterium]|nr:HAD family hydrolase [Gemmatimonadota bacterium]
MSDAPRRARRPALLLDRDGTIVRDAHYLRDPSQLELLPGVVEGLRRFQAAGWALVVVTNQSGIARGMFTEAQYGAVRDALDRMLAEAGVTLDGTFHCPHHPDVTGPCDCRKPATLLYERARDALGLDLAASVLAGDRWRDIAAAPALGARGILVPSADTGDDDLDRARREAEVADGLVAVGAMVLGG